MLYNILYIKVIISTDCSKWNSANKCFKKSKILFQLKFNFQKLRGIESKLFIYLKLFTRFFVGFCGYPNTLVMQLYCNFLTMYFIVLIIIILSSINNN